MYDRPVAEETMLQTISEVIKRGGPFMIMNVVCLAVVVIFVINDTLARQKAGASEVQQCPNYKSSSVHRAAPI